MARALLLKRPSPFAYPGGNPGFDPSHVASRGLNPKLGFSAVASGANMVNLLTGSPAVFAVAGVAPVAAINAAIGPCVDSNATNTGLAFLGYSGVVADITAAAIMIMTGTTGLEVVVGAVQANGSGTFSLDLAGTNPTLYLPTNVSDGYTGFTVGVPYFYAVSANSAQTNIIISRLDTGQVVHQTTVATGTSGQAFASYTIGNGYPTQNGFEFIGQIAAAMIGHSYLSPQQLLQWAQDPWSFWYPRKFDLSTMLKAASNSNINVNLGGAGCTASAGSLAQSDSFIIGGAAATVAAGALTPAVSAVLTGAGALAAAGILAPKDSEGLTGAAVSALAGTISFAGAVNVSIAGASVIAAAGQLTPAVSEALSGAGVTASAGSVSFASAINASIAGAQAAAQAGSLSLTASGSTVLTGAAASASAGSLAPMTAKTLAGAAATASAGALFSSISVPLHGAAVTALAGTLSVLGVLFIRSPRLIAVDAEIRLVTVDAEIRSVTLSSENRTTTPGA